MRDDAVLYCDIYDISQPFVYFIHLSQAGAIVPLPVRFLCTALWALTARIPARGIRS